MIEYEIRQTQRWPFPLYNVYSPTQWGDERVSGGFFTRRSAQAWINRELMFHQETGLDPRNTPLRERGRWH